METTSNAFALTQQRKQRKKRIRTLCIFIALAAVLAVAAIVLVPLLAKGEPGASVLTWQVSAVTEGEIRSTISGSGTLSAKRTASYAAPADATVREVFHQTGDRVNQGDTILTLSSDTLDEELASLEEQLDTLRNALANTAQEATSLYITAPRAGVVKQLAAAIGSVVEDAGALCLISTDGRMKLAVDAPETVQKYDVVSVVVGEHVHAGLVTGLSGGRATVTIEENEYAIGTEASVYDADGGLIGSGALELNEYVAVTGTAGRVGSVLIEENALVSRGSRLFKLEEGAPSATYLARKEQEAELLEQIAQCRAKYSVTAEWDALVTSVQVAAGQALSADDAMCSLAGTDGYAMELSVDELDVSSVQIDQEATLTMDAIDGTFSGRVSNLSYEGSGSYVTSYSATLDIAPIDGALPGMSASAEIITATSGQALIVPVDAIQYEGDQSYVYLADGNAALGTVYAEAEADVASLERVPVETGMSDGSYIAVTGELSAGARILVPVRATTSAYESDATSAILTPGGMMGAAFSGGAAGPMPEMGQMPSGGFGNGGRGSRPNE